MAETPERDPLASLPLRLVEGPGPEPVVSVDGAFGAEGLELSHWPGNRTPAELRDDLSTGIALRFARLPAARRAELARGAVAVAINHYDTDGACALFAVTRPGAALARERALLDVAAAGDLFRFPSERAFAIDALVAAVAERERTPWPEVAAAAGDRERREAALRRVVASLDLWIDAAELPHRDLWAQPLEDALADRADLAAASRDEVAHLELAVWTAAPGAVSTRPHARAEAFDPGRHALFGATEADRVLAIGPQAGGTTYRLVIGTSSWFELVTRRVLPRPDLEALRARLDALEGTRPEDEIAWRAQPEASPSPELWFGASEHAWFAEHHRGLRPSRLAPAVVRREVAEALRARWSFPEG